MDKEIGRICFVFNEKDNGGESLSLNTKLYHNGEPGGVYVNQELTLQSYCNCATFTLVGTTFTPENLRKLANELEQAIVIAKAERRT